MNWKVPFFDLVLGEEEKQAALSVIESNWLTTGPKIAEFETAFSETMNKEVEAIAVSSGTAALHLSLIALGIGPGDEVILPSLTFVACANVVRYVGATPIFADVNSESDWNISVTDVAGKITNQTRAIMVVHYAGYPCQMDDFVELCKKNDLFLIEDCSHTPLGRWRGELLGTFGDTGCFSFFSNKNMTTGEGGMIVVKNPELVKRLRILRSHGITSSTYERFKGHVYGYDVAELGYNYRMDEIRAAIGVEQLRGLPKINAKRKDRVERYRRLISEKLPQVGIPFDDQNEDASYHIFPIRLPGNEKVRERVLLGMSECGVQCSIHYRPIHTFSSYSRLANGPLVNVPVTDRIADSILTLPLFPALSNKQMDLVVQTLGDHL